MSTRHFYKHVETGIVSELNDDVAAVFGDRLERVSKSEAEDLPQVGDPTIQDAVSERRAARSTRKSKADTNAEDSIDEEAN